MTKQGDVLATLGNINQDSRAQLIVCEHAPIGVKRLAILAGPGARFPVRCFGPPMTEAYTDTPLLTNRPEEVRLTVESVAEALDLGPALRPASEVTRFLQVEG